LIEFLRLIIAIDGITDPQNLGAIIRSAAAFGVVAVVIPERRNASIGGSVWKSSAGAAARIPIAQVTNLVNIMNQAKENDYFVIGLDGDGQANFENFKLYDQSLFLIVGSEGKGISRLVREKCDQILSIQITNKVESLNASVATAIALHQISSKR
jgi:23S rRNA (guanosine2251-2'-O)-methyltransferase